MRKRKPCSVDGCDRLSSAHGLCNLHDGRMRHHGHTGLSPRTRWPKTHKPILTRQACTKCGSKGPFKRKRGGLSAQCKACDAKDARRRYWSHPDRNRAQARAWQKRNPDALLALWRKHGPTKQNRRRARMANAEATLTLAEWRAILEYFGHRCAYCLRGDRKLTQEHVIPVAKGGGHTAENVVPACQSCNSRKQHRSLFTMLAA